MTARAASSVTCGTWFTCTINEKTTAWNGLPGKLWWRWLYSPSYLHKLKGEYIAHSDLLKVRTPLHKLVVGQAKSRGANTSREVSAVVINYRAREVVVFIFSVSIPSGSLDIKSFKNLSSESAKIKGMLRRVNREYGWQLKHWEQYLIIMLNNEKKYCHSGVNMIVQASWEEYIRCFNALWSIYSVYIPFN